MVIANKGLHPTNFTNSLLYKTKNFITVFIKYYPLVTFYSFLIFPFFVVLVDVIVFTPVVCRFEQKQCCHLSSKAINMVCPINECVQHLLPDSSYMLVAL